eukprot:jgi/Mesvir1/22480/Mv04288-RA.1
MAKTRSQCRDSSLRHDRELVELVMSGIHKGWAVSMTDDGEVVFDIPADDDMEEDVSCDECDTDDDYDDDEEPEEAGTAAAPPRSKTAPRRSRCEGELVGGLETHELPDDDEAIHAVRAILGCSSPVDATRRAGDKTRPRPRCSSWAMASASG